MIRRQGDFWLLDAVLDEPVNGMLDLINRYDALRSRIRPEGEGRSLRDVVVQAPIPRPVRNVMCVGKNYHEHAHEFTRSGYDSSAKAAADAIPTAPIIFTKAPETVIADGEGIRYPEGVSDSLDYEAELARHHRPRRPGHFSRTGV